MSNLIFSHKASFDELKPSDIFTEVKFDKLPCKIGYIKIEDNHLNINAVSLRTGSLAKFSGNEMVFAYSQE